MIILQVLNGYDDPYDTCSKPRRMLYRWETIQVTPIELYEMLSNVVGDKYFKKN